MNENTIHLKIIESLGILYSNKPIETFLKQDGDNKFIQECNYTILANLLLNRHNMFKLEFYEDVITNFIKTNNIDLLDFKNKMSTLNNNAIIQNENKKIISFFEAILKNANSFIKITPNNKKIKL